MSMNEILAELDTLSPDELKIIQGKLDLLHEDIEITPEMLAAIDEGRRSAREEGTIPIEDVIKEISTWNTKSP
ncbi:MAG TPA: hypothetical protein VGZ93_05055 [Candidatus Methylacidiphilales bacterium]|jgi:hypothetical protein|nr:hypothetical protein [Candidatus Methylacidiphilales bacterium]